MAKKKKTVTPEYPQDIQLPALAVRDVVVFPNGLAPIFMGREKSIRASDLAMTDHDGLVMLVTQIDPAVDDPKQADLHRVGTLARIEQLLRLPDGTVKALVQGLAPYRISDVEVKDGALFATGELLQTTVSVPEEVPVLRMSILQGRERLAEGDRAAQELYATYVREEDPERLISLICSSSNYSVQEKIDILGEADLNHRLELLSMLVTRELQLRDIQKRVDARVKRQMEKNQREYYLNEQMKAIKKELGDNGEDGLDDSAELEQRIREAKLPKKVEEAAYTELKRLRQMPPMSSEATVVRGYLDTLLALPWTKKSRVSKDIDAAAKILDADHSGLEKVKERILEYLAVQKRVGKLKGPILCLVGAPGVGKTSLGESIARATGRKYVRMALGGVHDESEIRGHRRTYVGSMPGQIIKAMMRAGVKNPLFLLDEIDKVSSDYRGDPASALLEVLDPEQNNEFSDHYVELPYDLSDVMFVATSNSYNIPPALLDRMEVISLSGYTEEEKLHIARHHLIPKQMRASGLKEGEADITDDAVMDMIRYYTREAGVRGLERTIGKVLRKIVLAADKQPAAKGKKKPKAVVVTPKNLHDYLGAARYTIGLAQKEPRVGVVNGLAWTEVGGDLLSIETQIFPGKGNVQRTGSLGDVMKESVEAARSVVRARARELGIDPDKFYATDLHVHFPEGATPKDGPSAGAATTTAIISAMTGIAVKSDVAMTGEINLHGEVLEIGGLKEKLLAAVRAGCTKVLIPEPNVRDLEELPESAKKALEIVPVKTIDEVIAHALVKKPKALPKKAKPAAVPPVVKSAAKKPATVTTN